MNIDKFLNKAIKILMVCIISIMLIIGVLFIVPPHYAFALGNNDFTISYSSSALDNTSQYSGITVCNYSNGRYGNTYLKGTENSSLPVYGFRSNNGFYIVLPYQYSNYHSSNYELVCAGKTGDSGLTFSSTYYDDKFSYNSTYDLYYFLLSGVYSGAETFYVDSYNLNTAFSAIRDYIDNITPAGDFISLPQASYTSTFDFDTIKTFGAWVYPGYNIYSLYGSYNTINSPTSEYCYIDNGDNTYSCAVFSSVPLTVYVAFVNGETYTYYVCSQYDTGKYYYVFNQNVDISGLSVQPFDSIETAKSAFSGASSGGGSGSASGVVSAGAISIDVPAGNVLYVRPRPGSQARLEVRYPYLSQSYGNAFPFSAYWLSGVSSLPDSNTTFPLSGMTQINWSVDTSSVNGYGQSYKGFTTHAPFNSGWFVVYNPTYYFMNGADGHNVNLVSPTVTVNMQYAFEYQIYDLSMNLVTNESSSNTDYSTSITGSYDDTNDQWNVNSTTGQDTPNVGGQQQEIVDAQNFSITDYLHQIRDTLGQFASDFVQLLSAPIVFISNLIGQGTAFMTHIAQFFTWLPEPIFTLIVSALGVVVAIGIFKLLF